MGDIYNEYLTLLTDLGRTLSQLTEATEKKIDATKADDLQKLDQCIKQEQVLSLSLRSIEKKQSDYLARMGLEGVPLSGLSAHYPQQLRALAQKKAEEVRQIYDRYVSASQAARMIMESTLHQIDVMLIRAEAEAEAAKQAPGKSPMKADIRA